MLFDIRNIIFQELSSAMLDEKGIRLTVARLDKIHPVVSGNKLFKLHYFLEAFAAGSYSGIQTFGGAFSNHLVATAYACQQLKIPCKGIVRGERPARLSHTLQQCSAYGMQLEFVSREQYKALADQQERTDNILTIPEGGYHPLGAKGASLIMDSIEEKNCPIFLPVGTATTLAGILQKAAASRQVTAIPVLKGFTDTGERLHLLNGQSSYNNLHVWDQYHFGGYAKSSPELIAFMNELYRNYQLPTDFVYTAKMMFAVFDAIRNNVFAPQTKLLCLHTGGLQGNDSLPQGSLIF